VRVNVTLPEDALREIDSYAEAHGYTRSGFLVVAARRVMKDALDKEAALRSSRTGQGYGEGLGGG
jgi:metal-responsive CopG/Arc/MetJ family transcriptional regulator